MKIRNGFVSNSSSSSFVILGFLVPRNQYSDKELLEKVYQTDVPDDFDDAHEKLMDLSYSREVVIRDHEESGTPKDKTIIGIELNSWDSEYTELRITELAPTAEKVAQLQERLGVDSPVQIISGTTWS